MTRPPINWITTDTHFFHEKLEREGLRPAGSTTRIIQNLQELVREQDLLIHLGDVILYRYPDLDRILDSIPGRKVLTMGNHDNKSRWWFMRNGFDMAVDNFMLDDVVFSHRPMQQLPSGARINVHGHFHTHRRPPEWYDKSVYKLVALELTDYRPVNLATIATE